jgi:hypothetical protein
MNSLATLRWNQGGRIALRLQHQKDRRVRMVEADRTDRVEAAQVVFVRRVVAMPGHYIER